MAFTEQDKQAMDDAAVEAENDLVEYDEEAIELIAGWMKKWYMKAGYKRLGRILIQSAK